MRGQQGRKKEERQGKKEKTFAPYEQSAKLLVVRCTTHPFLILIKTKCGSFQKRDERD